MDNLSKDKILDIFRQTLIFTCDSVTFLFWFVKIYGFSSLF